MKRWLRRNWQGVATATVCIAVIVGGAWLLQPKGPDAGTISALAAAVSAVAAFLAARQSSATARDATRALSLSTKPQAQILVHIVSTTEAFDDEELRITVGNTSAQPMEDAVLTWQLRDGSRGRQELGSIGPAPIARGLSFGAIGSYYPALTIPIPGRLDGVDTFTVTFRGRYPEIEWQTTVKARVTYVQPTPTDRQPWEIELSNEVEKERV